jgi:hypothetical protein
MNRADMEKLLGGYGAGILTPEEERALFAAALEDQALFDALAREQPLRDLLQDPAARASLLAALADRPLPWYRRMAGRAIERRALAALAGILCVALPLTVWEARQRKPEPVLTARMAPPARVPAPTPNVVQEAAPPPVPKAVAAAAVKHKPEAKPAPPAGEDRGKAEAVGTTTGIPQTMGQLTEPAAPRSPMVAAPGEAPALPPEPQPSGSGGSRPVLTAAAPPAQRAQVQAIMNAPAPAVSPLQWSLLRREAGGEFAAADAGDLQAGDAVKLRLESQNAGYVYVVEKEKVLASSRVEAGTPFDAAIEPQGPGRRDLQLWFSPYQMVWPAVGQAQLEAFRASAGAQTGSGARAGKAVRAPGGGGSASAPPVSITITLNYR